ncbi:MAG TPA: Error-prone repair protein ImuA, partial [Chitinophagaceae bacterium]|nr:Error-prone repair protein ImuA [Chitinophagaceae bacterium]
VVRRDARKLSTTACIARWKISSIATDTEDDLPGIGFPRWKVELLRVRNGKSGVWDLEWTGKKFQPVMYPTTEQHELLERKTG